MPTDGRPAIDLFMAVWTPGSYLIREYERNVEAVTAAPAGRPLAVEKTVKNRWRITTGGAREVTRDLSRLQPRDDRPHQLGGRRLRDAERRADVHLAGRDTTGRTTSRSCCRPGGRRRSPACPTRPAARRITISRRTTTRSSIRRSSPATPRSIASRSMASPTILVNVGEGGRVRRRSRRQRSRADRPADKRSGDRCPTTSTCSSTCSTEASGGLEHRNSVLMMAAAGRWRPARQYVDWLSLASHEYFHLWNVKRLRPIELGPFDYEQRELPAQPVDRRRADRLLRRPDGPPRRPDDAVGYLALLSRRDQHAADDAGTPGADVGDGVVRRLDQALPPGREQPSTRRSATTRRAPSSASCSTRASAPRPTTARAWTM